MSKCIGSCATPALCRQVVAWYRDEPSATLILLCGTSPSRVNNNCGFLNSTLLSVLCVLRLPLRPHSCRILSGCWPPPPRPPATASRACPPCPHAASLPLSPANRLAQSTSRWVNVPRKREKKRKATLSQADNLLRQAMCKVYLQVVRAVVPSLAPSAPLPLTPSDGPVTEIRRGTS